MKDYQSVFCHRLKQARLSKGLSQKSLGILAGIDEFVASTRINRYEKGVHEPALETVERLATVLETPLAFFYTEDECLANIILNFNELPKHVKSLIHNLIILSNEDCNYEPQS